jgi:hypothetical protein
MARRGYDFLTGWRFQMPERHLRGMNVSFRFDPHP